LMVSGHILKFCASGLIYDGTECVRSHYHVLRARTRIRRYGGRRVPFSCFARSDSFSTVPRASGPVFTFGVPGLVFDDIVGVGSRIHVLHARTRFRRYRGGRVMFSCFARLDSFSAVPRASGPVFLFCTPGLVFRDTEGVRSSFHVFCPPGLVFGGTDGAGSTFHVLRSRTCFRLYRGRRVPFSCFALPDSFLTVPRASCPVFMFCAPRLVFDGTEGVGSRFHVLRYQTRFRLY
jgi:hypothetical protein